MITPECMSRHAGRLHEMVSKMVYFQNIMDDPINTPCFDGLPQYEKDMLRARVSERYAMLGTMLVTQANAKGVNFDAAKYADFERESDAEPYRAMLPVYSDAAAQALKRSEQMAGAAVREELERRMVRETAILERDARRLIENHPEEYVQNRELVDKLYQRIYRGIDSMGDYTLKSRSAQAVIDNIPMRCSATERRVKSAALKYQQPFNAATDKIEAEVAACFRIEAVACA